MLSDPLEGRQRLEGEEALERAGWPGGPRGAQPAAQPMPPSALRLIRISLGG
ncbi:MAG: hypothetical protein ACPL7C_05605 [Anaerolineae bacterium]